MSATTTILGYIEKSYNCIFVTVMRIVSPILTLSVYGLVGIHVYGWLVVNAFLVQKRLGTFFGVVWVAIGLSLVYNIVFNHFCCTFIKPGCFEDLQIVEEVRTGIKARPSRSDLKIFQNEERRTSGKQPSLTSDKLENVGFEIKKLMKYRDKTTKILDNIYTKACLKCHFNKPLMSHHCSICDKCVFVMDHHCPWVNNCIGLENRRYFLLFIFYLNLGVAYNLLSNMSVWNHYLYYENYQLMSFLTIVDFSLVPILFIFNLWNWGLASFGMTQIDFWAECSKGQRPNGILGNNSIRDNLYMIFGTYSLIQMFSPSLRNVPLIGLEFTFYAKDNGLIKDEYIKKNNDDDEEEGQSLNQRSTNEIDDDEEGIELNLSQAANKRTRVDNEI